MKNVDDLIQSAAELADRGLSKGEIADELNVSRETASWLVERSGAAAAPSQRPDSETSGGPHDIHLDWSTVGRDSQRLDYVGRAMADLLANHGEEVNLTLGIEKAGAPLATVVAQALETDMGTYTPAKHQWNEGDIEDLGGTFSKNFAQIKGRECYVVDDIITSGTTMTETVEAVREEGGDPLACCVIADKSGVDDIEGVPVYSLVEVLRVGDE